MKLKSKILAIAIVVISFSCGKPSPETKIITEQSENASTESNTEEKNLEILKTEASRLRGGGSIKNVTLNNGKASIEYVKNCSEYKRLNPQSGLTEKDLESYWDNGDAVQKALIDGSVRLMWKLDFINEVDITLPNKGKNYSISVNKSSLEEFIGVKFDKIINDWDSKFSNLYVYTNSGRNKFFKKFGKVE